MALIVWVYLNHNDNTNDFQYLQCIYNVKYNVCLVRYL